MTLWRGQLADAELCLDQAERILQRFSEPTIAMMIYTERALLEFARGRHEDAMTAHCAAERIERRLATRHILASPAQALKAGDPGALR